LRRGYRRGAGGPSRSRPEPEQPGASSPALQEQDTMSKKFILGLVLVSAFAACQRQQPEVDVYTPTADPVTTEPVYQGKYGAN
jgi:hypothetical protein